MDLLNLNSTIIQKHDFFCQLIAVIFSDIKLNKNTSKGSLLFIYIDINNLYLLYGWLK